MDEKEHTIKVWKGKVNDSITVTVDSIDINVSLMDHFCKLDRHENRYSNVEFDIAVKRPAAARLFDFLCDRNSWMNSEDGWEITITRKKVVNDPFSDNTDGDTTSD